MLVEWCYKGQDTYKSYSEQKDCLASLNFLKKLREGKTEYFYKDIKAIRIPLNGWLWISLIKNFHGKEDYYIVCGDYDIGKLYTFEDVEILLKVFESKGEM